MSAEHSRSVEIELKFDVDAETPLPDWTSVPGVASVSAPELRELDARYLDTDDVALARAGFALRRRTGGPDEGWHIKGPRGADGGRVELHWPLQDEIPDAATAALSSVTVAPLTPLARIRNQRTAYHLLDASGGVLAEFVDDHVVATDERTGVKSSWREWEVELSSDAPADVEAFVAAVTEAVPAAGGRDAASDSKLARTLGH